MGLLLAITTFSPGSRLRSPDAACLRIEQEFCIRLDMTVLDALGQSAILFCHFCRDRDAPESSGPGPSNLARSPSLSGGGAKSDSRESVTEVTEGSAFEGFCRFCHLSGLRRCVG